MENAAAAARRMWALFEPIHVVTYFSPEARAGFEQAGLRGFWRGYFGGRAAPMGRVGAAPVVAAFYVFAPAMVGRALPSIWELATPEQALAARQAGAVTAIRGLLGLPDDGTVPPAVVAAADQLMAVATRLDTAGRSLAAPNAVLAAPDEPVARLWQAATLLREHRGDGHVAALVAADIDGTEALALRAGVDRASNGEHRQVAAAWNRDQMQPARGWTDEQWDAADARLAARGLLTPDASATLAGLELHADVERATDRAAARPWAGLDQHEVARLIELLEPIARACAAVMPFPNPIGVPEPGSHRDGASR